MKKGKSRNKRKKTRSRLLWIAIAVIGIAAVISAVCVAGMLETKENAWRTPEELLVEYMYHIPKKEYEEIYAMLHVEASGSISQEDFIKRNSAIYEGIEVQNMAVRIIAYDEEQMTVTYQTSFDTVAGTISFENEALFLKDEEGYKLVWDDSMIFRNLTSTDKPRGFEEVEYPEYPYSEVVGFTENNDGTITLTANVVFPYAGDSKVY